MRARSSKDVTMARGLNENREAPRVVRFLRCKTTQRYFAEQGWTVDLNSAKAFPGAMEAAQACVRHGLADVELVLCAQNASGEIFVIRFGTEAGAQRFEPGPDPAPKNAPLDGKFQRRRRLT